MKHPGFKLLVLLLVINLFAINNTWAQSGRVRSNNGNSNAGSINRPTTTTPQPQPTTEESVPVYKPNVLPKGTVIDLHLNSSLSSKTAKKGEEFYINVSDPVIIGNQLLLSKQARVKCHIINAQAAGRKGRNGYITIGFDELVLDTGETFKLNATLVSVVNRTDEVIDENGEGKIKDPSKGKNVPVAVGTSAGVGATIGAVAGGGAGAGIGAGVGAGVALGGAILAKGKDIELLSGSKLQVRLDAELKLKSSSEENKVEENKVNATDKTGNAQPK